MNVSLQPLVGDEHSSSESLSWSPRVLQGGGQPSIYYNSHLGGLTRALGLSLAAFWIPLSEYKRKQSYFSRRDYGHKATIDDLEWFIDPIYMINRTQEKQLQGLACNDASTYYPLLKHMLYILPENLKVQQVMASNRDSDGNNVDAIGAIPFIVENGALDSVVHQAVSEYCGRRCKKRMICHTAVNYVPEFHNPDGTRIDSSVFFS